MSTSYENLQRKFTDHLSRYREQKRKAGSIFHQVARTCMEEHGIPKNKISFHRPSGELPDEDELPLELAIEHKPTGSWGLNIVIQVDNPSGNGSGHMISVVRPELWFRGSGIELSLEDGDTKVAYGDAEDANAKAIRDFTVVIFDYIDETILLLDKPKNERGVRIGFHPEG